MARTSHAGQPVNGSPVPLEVVRAAAGATIDVASVAWLGDVTCAARTLPPGTPGLLAVVSSTAPVGAAVAASPPADDAGAGWTLDAAVIVGVSGGAVPEASLVEGGGSFAGGCWGCGWGAGGCGVDDDDCELGQPPAGAGMMSPWARCA